jgi:hypothetical protein
LKEKVNQGELLACQRKRAGRERESLQTERIRGNTGGGSRKEGKKGGREKGKGGRKDRRNRERKETNTTEKKDETKRERNYTSCTHQILVTIHACSFS